MCDDGQRTYLRFPANAGVPMVYQILPDGREGVLGQSADPDPSTGGTLVTLHGVFPALRLRDGKAVLCISNHGYRPGAAAGYGTFTASPDVVRETMEPARVR
jgi:type IV secretory pathway VirB9-like protein